MWIIIILFCIFSCDHNSQNDNKEEVRIKSYHNSSDELDSIYHIQKNNGSSISRLEKIVSRNEQRINKWEHELIEADSTDSVSIESYISEMKNRVKIQKDRLKRLRRKAD